MYLPLGLQVTPEIMMDRLKDLRGPSDDEDEDEDAEGAGDTEVEGLDKFMTDLRQLLDGILDLKRR